MAKPYEVVYTGPSDQVSQQNTATLEDDTFLTQKLLIKNTDKQVTINCVCLFKGEIEIPNSGKQQSELYVYSELIWHLGKDMQVIGEWKGYSKLSSFNSYADVYFSSHILTCAIEAYVHCIVEQVNFKNEQKLLPLIKNNIFYNQISKNKTRLYDAAIDPLIYSYNLLAKWYRQFTLYTTQLSSQKAKLTIKQQKWKYCNLRKQNSKASQQELDKMMNTLKEQSVFQNLKMDCYNMSSHNYILWKNFLKLVKEYWQSPYFQNLKKCYHRQLQKDHWANRIRVISQNGQPIKQAYEKQAKQLQFCSVEQHNSQIKLSGKDLQLLKTQVDKKKSKLIVLVHGFQASSFDMEMIGMYIKFRNPDCHIMISQSNQGMTEGVIEECGHRLAVEVKNYINARELKNFSISFIGHSLGGLIIRASLRYLQLYKNSFDCYVSICSPHMGYLYHTSKIVTTSIWVMNQIKKDQSMIQLSMSDNKTLNKCYIYELSERNQLTWFNSIILLGSKQDQYVPFSSALLQNMDFFYQSQSAKIYQTMYNNIVKPIESKIIRLEVVFNDKVKDLSGFIGRTAHIKVLSYLPTIDLYCYLISKRI